MYHYVYQIISFYNTSKIKHYIGVRSSRNKPEDDKYMGSGRLIRQAINKHGIDKFKKIIIGVFETREEANAFENLTIAKMLNFFGSWSELNKVSYNLRLNNYNGVEAGNNIWSDETIAKVSGKNHHAYGKKFKEETRIKMSNAQKGVKKTPEHIENVKIAMAGKIPAGFKSKEFRGFSIGVHLETGKVIVFCGAKDVEERGFLNGGISSSVSGRTQHYRGYSFYRTKDPEHCKLLLSVSEFVDDISSKHLKEYIEWINE